MEDDITEDYIVCMDNGLGLVVHLLVFLLDLPASIHQAKNKQWRMTVSVADMFCQCRMQMFAWSVQNNTNALFLQDLGNIIFLVSAR